MKNYKCIVCGKEMTSTTSPITHEPLPCDASHLIAGAGYACSDECVDRFAQERKEKIVDKKIEEMKGEINEAMGIMKIWAPAIAEIIEENIPELMELMRPISKVLATTYKDMVLESMNEVDDVRAAIVKTRVNSILEAVAQLESAGFTREQAISLLGK